MDELNRLAHAEGWEMAIVIDGPKTFISVFGTRMTNAQAKAFVTARAKSNSATHLQALQLCAHSRMPIPPPRKSK